MTKKPKEKRTLHVSVWLAPSEYADVSSMAAKDQDPPSTWLRKLALREKATRAGAR